MNNNINNNQIAFTARPNTKKVIHKIKPLFYDTFPNIKSPSRVEDFEELAPEGLYAPSDLKKLIERLRFVRHFINTLNDDVGIAGYFRGLIGMIKTFNVANCAEHAEITKTILKLNRIKNVDMFSLYAKDKDGQIRELDHAIVALNVSKSKNNKKTRKLFKPTGNTPIVDMWWPHGLVGKLKNIRKQYRQIGLKDSDTILLRPIKTYEPTQESFNRIVDDFPQLKFN